MNVCLSGTWRGRPDPDVRGVHGQWFAAQVSAPDNPDWEPCAVPSCWNADPRYERYEGAFWYATDFSLPADRAPWQTRAALRFDAVNYLCRVWVNGQEIGSHQGGYLPFEFSLDAAVLRHANRLVVMAENKRSDQRIPGRLCDWYNYGGIVRHVHLIVDSPRRFACVRVTAAPSDPGKASFHIAWKQQEPFAFSWAVGDGDRILAQAAVDPKAGQGEICADLSGVEAWSPDSPKLYELRLTPEPLAHAEPFVTRFGIRSIQVQGHKILLNGQPLKMQGVSLHEELVPHGRAVPEAMRREDVQAIKDLGFNALRTAHYTHDEALLHAADEIGLLVLEEIPVYWDIDYASEKVYQLAESMVRDMIARDYNHPCVIQWSVGNEVPVERKDCDRFMRRLMDCARSLDATRIVTYVSCRFLIDDTTRRAADTACINCYFGWYMGRIRDVGEVMQLARMTAPDKPWIMAEFGAGALAGNTTQFLTRMAERGPEDLRSIMRRGIEKLSVSGAVDIGPTRFSEEYQEKLLAHYIRTLNAMDWVAGWFIWIYRDFRSPIRTNPFQNGFNRKGIVSETNVKKTICFQLPDLLEETRIPEPVQNPELKFRVFKALERAAYKVFQPKLARVQRKMYDAYYSDKLEK
jgi:beta-glucuronidase